MWQCVSTSMGRQSRIQNDFEVLKWLGKGAFGDVLKVKNNLDGRIYAIKCIELNPKEEKLNKNITREVKLLSRMNHENVVRYYNSWIESGTPITTTSSNRTTTTYDKADISTESSDFERNGISQKFAIISNVSNNDVRDTETSSEDVTVKEIQFLYIQMEFCEKSTLRTAIDNDLYEDKKRVWRLFREIVEGLVYIHQQNIIHRDLKPVNICLDSNDHVQIGDFGLARMLVQTIDADKESQFERGGSFDVDELGSLTGQVGTALYVAPELSAKTTKAIYNEKVDIYSLGIIFFEMTYKPLATKMERIMILLNLRSKEIVFPSDITETNIPEVHIIRWLLNHDPSQRPTAQELLSSAYLPPLKLEETDLSALMKRHMLSNSQNTPIQIATSSKKEQKETVQNYSEPQGNDENKLPHFPIVTVQELENFNELLEDKTARAQYEKIIKNIGAEDVKKHVRQALTLILNNEFSCKLSWTGQKETIKVKDMKFVDIMIESMINSGHNCTISDVQDIIKKWLQRASDRIRYI